jgi:peptidoglycan biosynthesis protein MviN/MurJ (putative lipid II flippase)
MLGVMGIALSTALVGWVLLALLHRASKKHHTALTIDARLTRTLPRIFLATGLLALFLAGCRYGGDNLFDGPVATRILPLLALIAGSLFVYGAALFATRAISPSDLRPYFSRQGRVRHHDSPPPPFDS